MVVSTAGDIFGHALPNHILAPTYRCGFYLDLMLCHTVTKNEHCLTFGGSKVISHNG